MLCLEVSLTFAAGYPVNVVSCQLNALLETCKLANGVQAVAFSESAGCLSAIERGPMIDRNTTVD